MDREVYLGSKKARVSRYLTNHKRKVTGKGWRRTRVGDVFAIPLDDHKVAAGIVLHVSEYFGGSVLMGYFDSYFESLGDIVVGELVPSFAFTPNYLGKPSENGDDWLFAGNREELVEKADIPILVMVTDLFYKDEIIEKLPS